MSLSQIPSRNHAIFHFYLEEYARKGTVIFSTVVCILNLGQKLFVLANHISGFLNLWYKSWNVVAYNDFCLIMTILFIYSFFILLNYCY